MILSSFYNLVVKLGAEFDPRKDKKNIKSYADTAILYGDPDTKINKILAGVDIEVAELLLADRIRSTEGLDLVLAHHPEGSAWATFYNVMQLQVDMLENLGVPRKSAQEFLDERMREVERRVMPNNHMRSVDAARLLNMPFMCAHTPADNHAFNFIHNLLNRKKPDRVEDIIDTLMQIPEYQEAEKNLNGPQIIMGSPKRKVGKILVEMTGGTEGPKDIFEKLYTLGVRTLVSMHLSEEHLKKVKDVGLNVVIAGHISSDNLGINLLLDRIEKKAEEKLQVLNCSGFRRIRRN